MGHIDVGDRLLRQFMLRMIESFGSMFEMLMSDSLHLKSHQHNDSDKTVAIIMSPASM